MKNETELSRRNFLKAGAMISAAMAASPILNNAMAGESVLNKSINHSNDKGTDTPVIT